MSKFLFLYVFNFKDRERKDHRVKVVKREAKEILVQGEIQDSKV